MSSTDIDSLDRGSARDKDKRKERRNMFTPNEKKRDGGDDSEGGSGKIGEEGERNKGTKELGNSDSCAMNKKSERSSCAKDKIGEESKGNEESGAMNKNAEGSSCANDKIGEDGEGTKGSGNHDRNNDPVKKNSKGSSGAKGDENKKIWR